jgi:hypothetical protein
LKNPSHLAPKARRVRTMLAALLVFSSTLGVGLLGTWIILLIGRLIDERTYTGTTSD